MRYLSVCSGIEAATVAWKPLGWSAVAYSEIEPFACAVLEHHYPHTPNRGDMTNHEQWPTERIDLLVGGTPCQSFSVAGRRKGMDDDRGNFTRVFLAIAAQIQPAWLLWENVPGVLSIDEGRTFGAVLGTLAELGYGFAYRVLDAQHFGVPQSRRRVFVVGYLGDWRAPAAVLFDRESLRGNPPKSKSTQSANASAVTCHHGRNDGESTSVAHCLRGEGFDASEDGTGRGSPLVAFSNRQDPDVRDVAPSCEAKGNGNAVMNGSQVRRLTPREWERLQGFPDDYTLIPYKGKPAKDSPRYRAIGNSMAVPVMRWIGKRIQTLLPDENP